MKNNKENKEQKNGQQKNSIKKQLVSGGVYIALAAAIVTVTMGSVSKIMNGDMGFTAPEVELKNNLYGSAQGDKNSVVIPNIIAGGRDNTDFSDRERTPENADNKAVSGTKEGVKADISPAHGQAPEKKTDGDNGGGGESGEDEALKQAKASAKLQDDADVPTPSDDSEIPDESKNDEQSTETVSPAYPTDPEDELFDGKFYKVTDGYISRAFSMDELLYSPTMKDFRTHNGIDLTGDPASAVRIFAEGQVKDIFTDPLMGKTVVIDHGDGISAHYSNLSDEIPQNIVIGNRLKGGTVIGGIGNTATSECADVSHVHLSIVKDGSFIDPAKYLSGK